MSVVVVMVGLWHCVICSGNKHVLVIVLVLMVMIVKLTVSEHNCSVLNIDDWGRLHVLRHLDLLRCANLSVTWRGSLLSRVRIRICHTSSSLLELLSTRQLTISTINLQFLSNGGGVIGGRWRLFLYCQLLIVQW